MKGKDGANLAIHIIVKKKTTPMAMIVRNAMKGIALTILSCVEGLTCCCMLPS